MGCSDVTFSPFSQNIFDGFHFYLVDMCRIDVRKGTENLASLSRRILGYRKSSRGGVKFTPPPSAARVNKVVKAAAKQCPSPYLVDGARLNADDLVVYSRRSATGLVTGYRIATA